MESEKYFQSFKDYFWEWDNHMDIHELQTITIPNGNTIAYEDFVLEVLEFLTDDGFPPFGSLLLAIIATNPQNQDAIEMIRQLGKSNEKSNDHLKANDKFYRIGAAIDFLEILSSLPEEYKTGEKRIQLFQTIFQDCHNRISTDKAKKILYQYKAKKNNSKQSENQNPFNESNFIKDFRIIDLLKVKFPTVQSVLNAMENLPQDKIIEQLNEEIFDEQTAGDKPLDFIEELIQEEKTFQIGSLVKHIWSGLNIPLHHNIPSAQPLGGISDLTNKGDFDKLVISEFANDDDVFMSRIANYEALYIQREVPPEADKFQRIILIDTTLINWGNPKILGFASALAIVTHPKTDIECKIFAVGDGYQEIYFQNVNQVIDALSKLSGKLSCSEALDLFFIENLVNEKSQEVFLISSDESLKLKPMQKAMSDYFVSIKYVVVTNVEGTISIFRNQNKGKKLLQEITMPLKELWKKNSIKEEFITNISTDNSIPLLYPAERNYQNVFHYGDKYYLYLNGNLFLFHKEGFDKGFIKIASNLPFNAGEFAIKGNAKGELLLLNYSYGSLQTITIVNLSTNECKNHKAFSGEFQNVKLIFFEYNQMFYCTNNVDFWIVKSDFHVEKDYDPSVVKAFDDYYTKKSVFIQNYRNNKSKYNVIKRLDYIVIDNNNTMRINDYYLYDLEFIKVNKQFSIEKIALNAKVNLVLKHKGSNPITTVKLIVSNTDKSLKEANTVIGNNFGLILETVTVIEAENLKLILENNGATCYIETVFFESKDGSRITNKDGILIFESSNKELPVFYIPFVTDRMTTMATETEFTGNTYFISEQYAQKKKESSLFRDKYLNPFISNIVQYGV